MSWNRWVPVLLYMAGLFALSSIQNPPALPGRSSDKLIHAALYAGLGAVSLRGLVSRDRGTITFTRALGAMILAAGYGVFDEWHQSFVPGRQSEVADVMADTMGAGLASVGLWVWGILTTRRRNSEYRRQKAK